MKEKTIEKFQSKITKLQEEIELLKDDLYHVNSLNLEYKKRMIKSAEEVDLYKNMWNTSKLFIIELLKNVDIQK